MYLPTYLPRMMWFVALGRIAVRKQDGEPDYTDTSKTENTRVSYPIYHIHNYEPSGVGGHPSAILFLTCDAFGVLPPVSRLNPGQVRAYLARDSFSLALAFAFSA